MVNGIYKHVKSEGIYKVLHLANAEQEEREGKTPREVQVVYQGEDGRVWSKELSEWDTRFSLISKGL